MSNTALGSVIGISTFFGVVGVLVYLFADMFRPRNASVEDLIGHKPLMKSEDIASIIKHCKTDTERIDLLEKVLKIDAQHAEKLIGIVRPNVDLNAMDKRNKSFAQKMALTSGCFFLLIAAMTFIYYKIGPNSEVNDKGGSDNTPQSQGDRSAQAQADVACPKMPDVALLERSVKTTVDANATTLKGVTGGHLLRRTEETQEALFAKFPAAQRLVMVQLLGSTYCRMLYEPGISSKERIDRWMLFQGSQLGVQTELPSSDGSPVAVPMAIATWTGDGSALSSDGRFRGAWHGTPSFGPGPTSSRGAFAFDGSNFVEVSSAPSLNVGVRDFSVAFWVFANAALNDEEAFVSKDNFAGDEWHSKFNGWLFNYSDEYGGWGFEVRSMPSLRQHARTKGLSLNEWHYIVGVRQGESMRLFVDGQLKSSSIGQGVADLSNNAPLRIGALSDASLQPMRGRFARLEVFDAALSDRQVQQLYQAERN